MKREIELRADIGDRVMVRNYRKRSGQWEPGLVMRVTSYWGRGGSVTHSYDCRLDRMSTAGNPVQLAVGGDDVRPEREEEGRRG